MSGWEHPDVTEWLSYLGFDWILLDAEHGPLGFETLQQMMQSMSGTDCVPIVRPQWNDPVVIKRVLDIGVYGVPIPWVNSKEEAEVAVRACKYPPAVEVLNLLWLASPNSPNRKGLTFQV